MRFTFALRKGLSVFAGTVLVGAYAFIPTTSLAVPTPLAPPYTETIYTVPAALMDITAYQGDTDVGDSYKQIKVGFQAHSSVSSLNVDSSWPWMSSWVTGPTWSSQPITQGTTVDYPLSFNISTLPIGNYGTNIQFDGAGGSPTVESASVQINLQIISAYTFSLNPTSFNLMPPVGTPVSANLALSNGSGSGKSMPFTLTLKGGGPLPTWLTLSALSGTLTGSPTNITVTVDPEGRTYGETESCVLVLSTTEPSVTENDIEIPVSFTVVSPEGNIALEATPSSLSVESYELDTAPDVTFKLNNVSTMNLDYESSATASHMSLLVSPDSGTVAALGSQVETVSFPDSASLSVGSYTGTVHVTTTTISSSYNPIEIPVTLTVMSAYQPAVTTPVSTFDQTVIYSRRNQVDCEVYNSSLSDKEMNVTLVSNVDWLKLSTRSGRVTNLNRLPLTLTYDSTGYEPGVYSGSFVITGTSVQDPNRVVTRTVNVTMTVVLSDPAGFSSLYPPSFDIQLYETDNASTRRFNIVNASSMILDYAVSVVSDTINPWILPADPQTGTVRNNTLSSVRLNFNTNPLTPGNYTGSATVTSTSLTQYSSSITLPINLTVKPAFKIATDTIKINKSVVKGQAFDGNIAIWNALSNKNMKYTVTSPEPWIMIRTNEGVVTWNDKDSISYRIETNDLASGDYEGSIVITAESVDYTGHPATNTGLTIPVKLRVTDAPRLSTNLISQTTTRGKSPGPMTFKVWNNCLNRMNFTVRKETVANWFDVSPLYGVSENPTDIQTFTVTFNSASLAPGTYTGRICVYVPTGDVVYNYINVVLTVNYSREIAVTPTTLTFNVPVDQTRTIDWQIWNKKPNDIMTYQLVPLAGWVRCSKTTGSVGTTPDVITVTADATGKIAGSYTSSIIIYADDAYNSPREIIVTMNVTEPTKIASIPTSISLSLEEGATSRVVVQVKNELETVPMHFYMATDATWITPNVVSAYASDTYIRTKYTIDTTGLKVGTYTANIRLTVPDGSCENSPYLIPVTLTVIEPEFKIALDPNHLNITCYEAELPTYTIAIWNEGSNSTTPLDYQINTSARWITIEPQTGSMTADKQYFTIKINTLDLIPGYTYNGSLVITATGAANSPRTMPIVLTLKAVE